MACPVLPYIVICCLPGSTIYCNLLPARFYHIFPHYLIQKARFLENAIEHKICVLISSTTCLKGGAGSVVGIETGYGLDGPGIKSRWGARFAASVQTGPGAHPASFTMGTGSLQGVKSGRGVTLNPSPTLSAVGHERVELYLYSPYGPYGLYRASVPVQGCTLPFFFICLRDIYF